MNDCSRFGAWVGLSALAVALAGGTASPASAQGPAGAVKGQPLKELMSSAGFAALQHVRAARSTGVSLRLAAPVDAEEGGRVLPENNAVGAEPGPGGAPFGNGGEGGAGAGPNQRFQNVFVNDPCLDPAPTAPFPVNFFRTVQSETEIAVLNDVSGNDGGGRLMVAGYNDSFGFDDNRQGLSGFSYSTDGGESWIDAGGLPPRFPTGAPAGTPGSDAFFGDPVVAVHHKSKMFFYSSIYLNAAGGFTLSVNSGRFKVANQQVPVESNANTRCEGNPAAFTIPDPPAFKRERILWEKPVEAVAPELNGPGPDDDDFLDKEWLSVDQNTGFLYLTYTRFAGDGSTPLELVRSFDGGKHWTAPTTVVPNLNDTFNQATQAVVTPTGRVIVSWLSRVFPAPTFAERAQFIQVAFSDDGGASFGPPVNVASVNPQGEPPGYNRGRATILNAPFIMVDKGRDDGKFTQAEQNQAGFGNVYLTYFDGKTALAQAPAPPTTVFARAGEIHLSVSQTNGTTWGPEVKVNDDNTQTSHVFPSVEVNQEGRVFVTWIDRRFDPGRNLLSDTFGDISRNRGQSFRGDVRLSDVSTDWIVRADAAPNFGDYNSSLVINFTDFASIWADGRFPTPGPLTPTPSGGVTRPAAQAATPDAIFEIFGEGD